MTKTEAEAILLEITNITPESEHVHMVLPALTRFLIDHGRTGGMITLDHQFTEAVWFEGAEKYGIITVLGKEYRRGVIVTLTDKAIELIEVMHE
jgi:hypothetical protein